MVGDHSAGSTSMNINDTGRFNPPLAGTAAPLSLAQRLRVGLCTPLRSLAPQALVAAACVALAAAYGGRWDAQGTQSSPLGYSDTPMLPGGKWHVHDGNRPQPPVVTPGPTAGAPPSDAVILFGGNDLSNWQSVKDGSPAPWKVESGELVVAAGTGNIATRAEFGD